ncbi:hypothetical protein FHS18_004855 [Paenibacillus phyllosphaerae]|uniref:Uncharacterized protein n=1 Tax=Paenibacillus phyllosphaerae TaxID=274593 RepID=A0A7W5FPZ4_9BACL|nr:hypothetical protein [Paenibacillus phyllosphaerae]MBB3112753.1 hypothetical protein [Paenibacillus phyllosphaerae]
MPEIIRVLARGELRAASMLEGEQAAQMAATPRLLAEQGAVLVIACYRWERQVFLYYECVDDVLAPEQVIPELTGYLAEWPGQAEPRSWIPMIDVFHFNDPASISHWQRKQPVERRAGRVAHLKPEMAASYIYYHYQLQEERAFLGPKYEIIAMHENVLFGYQEFPAVVEEPILPKKLATNSTPVNWSDSRMDLHFQPWPDGHLYFKPVQELFAHTSADYAVVEAAEEVSE